MSNDDQSSGPEQDPHRMPGWVRGFVIVAIVVVVVAVVAILAGGGHGPSRHVPDGNGPSAGVRIPVDHAAPAGHDE